MCLGVPMQVVECGLTHAICADRQGRQRRIDMMLVGRQPPGSWVLVFIDAAREVLDAQQAARISDALAALDDVIAGGDGNVDVLFADIIDAAEERDRREGR